MNWLEHLQNYRKSREIEERDYFFHAFYDLYFEKVFLIALSRVPTDAKDITQDFFVDVILNPDKLSLFPTDTEGNFLNYFYRSVLNHCNDAYKRHKRKRSRLSLLGLNCNASATFQEGVGTAIEITRLLKKLPKTQRIAIILFLEGYSAKDIARILKISLSAIKMRIFRGKITLRNYLKGHNDSNNELYLLKCL